MNTIGNIFRLTTAGESHGEAMTAIVDGMPAGVRVSIDDINEALARRRPGDDELSSPRKEPDRVRVLSGIMNGVTLGTPVAMVIDNVDARSDDYARMRDVYRPSHADYTYDVKYGIRDHRGGGRASARETALRVAAGALADAALAEMGIRVYAYTSRIGNITVRNDVTADELNLVYKHRMRCPDPETDAEMARFVKYVREAGDTVGGIVAGIIDGMPAGIGEPVYGKLQAMLASAMMSINAAKGFDYGMGFDGACRLGSEMNDHFVQTADGRISTVTNHSGGIQGGITNGRAVNFRVAFKPVATLMREMAGIDRDGRPVVIQPRGRHDACVVPRAVAVVSAMASITVFDAILLSRSARI